MCLDYAREPLHLLRMGQARDALRIWSGAPFSARAFLGVLPGHLAAAGVLALGVAAAWCAGRGPAGWFGAGPAPLRLALGLGVGSLGMFGAGLAGLWRPGAGWAGALALAIGGAACRMPRGARTPAAAPAPIFPGWVAVAALALATASLAVNLLGALTPETGYDSLIQHLADVRDDWSAGRIFFNDLTSLAQHPAGIEMLYAWLLPAGGDTAAKLLHALLAVATAWTFGAWALRSAARSDAALLACVLYLTPFHGILSSRAYIDLGLTFYSAAALLAPWGSWTQGAVLGLAVGTKYLGGYLLIGWLVSLVAAGRRPGAMRVAVAASVTAGVWGFRNWLTTGNPVYPFAYGWLGGIAWGGLSASEYGAEITSYGRVTGPAAHLAVPWLAVVHDKGALDDGSLGPVFLAALPLVLLGAPAGAGSRHRLLGWLLAAVWALWLVSPRQVRYALMLLPPTYAALLPGLRRAAAAWPRGWRASTALLPLVLLVNLEISFAAIYLWANPLYVALGMESRGEYLARVMEPRDPGTGRSLYLGLMGWLPEHLPPSARTYMLGDAKVYYLPGRWRVNALFNPPLLAGIVRTSSTPADAAKRLRQRGITHVLYNVGGSIHIEYTHHLFAWTPRDLALVEELFRARLRPVARQDTTEGDPMYLLFEMRAGRWPDPPYLPGVDTRIAGVEEAAIRKLTPDAATQARALLRDFPASRMLRARLAPYLKSRPATPVE
ncbi:MAG: hypothetical protein AAB152_13845 [Candidatus Coatesbacteria bacterium]